jgi:hypothetical protein
VPGKEQLDIVLLDRPQRRSLTANRTRIVEAAAPERVHYLRCSARTTGFTTTIDEYACVVCRLYYEFAGSSFNEEHREDAKRVAMEETIRERMTATALTSERSVTRQERSSRA